MATPFRMLFLALISGTCAVAETYPIKLYRSHEDMTPQSATLVGKINTKGKDNSVPPRQILGYDMRTTIVSASIDNAAKVYPGMKVFIVRRERDHIKNQAALIVAEGEVDSISDTVFSGRVAQIHGQFSMVSRQHFVAIPSQTREGSLSAEEYLQSAERYRHTGDTARSLQMLEHAREREPNNPLVNLRYASISLENGAEEKADAALRRAFKDRRRLEDVNDYLTLGTEYATSQVAHLPSATGELLKSGTKLLGELRVFEKDLGQYSRDLTPPKSSELRKRGGRFSANYHLAYGRLMRRIAGALKEYSPAAVGKLLEYAGRDQLYAPLEIRVGSARHIELPRKTWDKAYFEAAITHFELALKKDRHSEAAFEIIDLCDALWADADSNRRAYLKDLVARYAPQYLEAPHDDSQMARVRRVVNKVNQA